MSETNEETSDADMGVDSTSERLQQRHAVAIEKISDFVVEAARNMSDSHCEDVVIFDVRGKSDVTDYILIGSGTSDRQMKSVADDIEVIAKQVGLQRFGKETDNATMWIVVDFVDVVIHLFEPQKRAHYDLEMMWGDAPRLEWRRNGKSG